MIQDVCPLDPTGYLNMTTKNLFRLMSRSVSYRGTFPRTDWLHFAALVEMIFDRFVHTNKWPVEGARSLLRNQLAFCVQNEFALQFLAPDKRYRDHFVHQFNVGSLGYILLTIRLPGSGKTLVEEMAETKGWTEKDVYASWWIAALFHDSGYLIPRLFGLYTRLTSLSRKFAHVPLHWPVSLQDWYQEEPYALRETYFGHASLTDAKASDLVAYLTEILCPRLTKVLAAVSEDHRARPKVGEAVREIVTEALDRLGFSDAVASVLESDPWDHGALGACNLLELAQLHDTRWDGKPEAGVLVEALRAIAVHNSMGVTSIDMKNDPIAYLLVLCDEIQEWGRERVLPEEDFVELKRARIGPLAYAKDNSLMSNDTLHVRFVLNSTLNVLQSRTGWDREVFLQSKERSLGRLIGPWKIEVIV